MADILLIQPPIRDFYLTRKRTIPYGLTSIAAALIDNGFSVILFDGLATSRSRPLPLPAEMHYLKPFYAREDISPFGLFHRYKHFGYSFEYLGKIVRESNAFLVGISSLFTAYAHQALRVAEIVKSQLPNSYTVLGGHHPTALPEAAMQHPAIDFIIRGEGEEALPQLAKSIRNGDALEQVPGIVIRKPGDKLFKTAPALVKNLDAQPLPGTDLVKKSYYRRNGHPSAVIVASRGCPMQCSYCSLGRESVISYRRRSVQNVITEIESAVLNDGVRFIDFEDENLSLDSDWFLELLTAIKTRFAEFNIELRAMNGLFPPSLNAAVIHAMQAAGFRSLNLSLGTIDASQQARFKRPDVKDLFDAVLKTAATYHMNAVGYVIAAAPGQRAEDSLGDLIYLAQRRVLAGLSIFYPAPGSCDFKHCRHAGKLPNHYALLRSSALPLDADTNRYEAITLLRLTRILNFMKRLVDENIAIPVPAICKAKFMDLPKDKIEIGRILLQWFLYDGRIRGVGSNGEIYEHTSVHHLARRFIHELRFTGIRGVITSKRKAF